MQVKHDPDGVTVRFSATEVASVGLPAKPATITYQHGLLSNYSVWLEKQMRFDQGIDKLISLADTVVYH